MPHKVVVQTSCHVALAVIFATTWYALILLVLAFLSGVRGHGFAVTSFSGPPSPGKSIRDLYCTRPSLRRATLLTEVVKRRTLRLSPRLHSSVKPPSGEHMSRVRRNCSARGGRAMHRALAISTRSAERHGGARQNRSNRTRRSAAPRSRVRGLRPPSEDRPARCNCKSRPRRRSRLY